LPLIKPLLIANNFFHDKDVSHVRQILGNKNQLKEV